MDKEILQIGDRVMGAIGLGTVVAVVDLADPLYSQQVPNSHRVFVLFDSPSWDFMAVSPGGEDQVRGVPYWHWTGLKKVESVAPRLFCPECGEEDYCLEEDYLCAPCRFLVWDGS